MKHALRFTSVLLIAANIVPLVGVLAWGWSAFDVVFLYWFENLIVGFYNVLRMLSFTPREGGAAIWISKVFFVPFFCVHYGIFTLVHGAFLFMLFGEGMPAGPAGMMADGAAHANTGLQPAILALFVSHGVSFGLNYIGSGEFREGVLADKMMAPYGRVVVLHLAILLGAFATQLSSGDPMIVLILLVIGKIILDVVFHRRSHRGKSAEPSEGARSI